MAGFAERVKGAVLYAAKAVAAAVTPIVLGLVTDVVADLGRTATMLVTSVLSGGIVFGVRNRAKLSG